METELTEHHDIEDRADDSLVSDILERSSLSEKRQAFVREYVVDFNGAQAAIRAGYSEKGARQQASHLLTNIDIAKCVRDVKRARAKALGTEHEDITAFHAGVLHDPNSTTQEKDRASDKLSKLHGYYITKVQVSGKDDGPVEVAVSPSSKLRDLLNGLAERNTEE